MQDQELKIFFQKIKKNPSQWILIFSFGHKLFVDILQKKFLKKNSSQFVLTKEKDIKNLVFFPLQFVKKYSKITKKTNFHFSNATETDKLDEQYFHYNQRFYKLPFATENDLEAAILEINNWIENNSISNNINWHSYNVSERIVNWSIFLSRFSDKLSETEKQIISISIYNQADFLFHNLEYHLGHHNHLMNNARSLLFACSIFKNEKAVERWKQKAFSIINIEMQYQVLCDGVHAEQSATYHLLLNRTLWELRELYSILNEPFNFEKELAKMVEYSQWLIRKNNSIPLIGHVTPDYHWKELVGLATLWTQNSTIEASSYSELFNPNYCLKVSEKMELRKLFPSAGIGIIKTNEIEIHFSNDPRTSVLTHGDQNPLGIDISWNNSNIIRDCGLHTYTLNQDRKLLESWQGQSTCVVNNINPIVINWRKKQLPRKHYKAIATLEIRGETGFIASHNYYKRLPNTVKLSREVVLKNNKIIITDSTKSTGNNAYNAIFHFGSFDIKRIDNTILIYDNLLKNSFCFTFPKNIIFELKPYIYATSYGVKEVGISLFISFEIRKKEEFFIYSIEKK